MAVRFSNFPHAYVLITLGVIYRGVSKSVVMVEVFRFCFFIVVVVKYDLVHDAETIHDLC